MNLGWTPQGALNWRDVGGLPTSDGGVVRAGRLFRSDTLQDLTTDDVDVLTGRLAVRTVLDLRHRDESRAEGSGLLGMTPVRHYNVPLHGDWHADPAGPLPATGPGLPAQRPDRPMTPVRPFAGPIDADTGAPPRCLRLQMPFMTPNLRVMTHASRLMACGSLVMTDQTRCMTDTLPVITHES